MTLKDGTLTNSLRFMGSSESYHDSQIILIGAPMDYTSSFKPGSRFGPQKIREISEGIEEYSPYTQKDLCDCSFFDAGDLDLPFGNVKDSLEVISEAAREILDDGKTPLFIGGEHLISTPVIKEVHKKHGDDLVVFHFDAHADLREGYKGFPYSHASAIRRLCDFMPGKNIYQFGIRSGTREEFEFAKENTNIFPFEVIEPLKQAIKNIGDRPLYVTLDIDVVDPAYANGTGTPEPGGITSAEMIKAVNLFAGLNLVGFDLVEVLPVYDASDRTALLAAKIIRDAIAIISD